MRDFRLGDELNFLKSNLLGYIDPLGGFILPLKQYHIDPYAED